MIKIRGECFLEGQKELIEKWNELKDSLRILFKEDGETESCSTQTLDVLLNEQIPGKLYLRQFGDKKIIALTFEDSDVWVDINTFEVDYPANWHYSENFKIEMKLKN